MSVIMQIIPNLNSGGAERGCVDVAAALTRAGHKAIVVSAGGAMVGELTKAGAKHISLKVASKNPIVMIKNIFTLARLIKEKKIDLVHARSRAPAWSAFFACKIAHVPFMTTFHASYSHHNFLKKLYNSVMVRGVRVIAISKFIENHIKENYTVTTDKIRLIPRGIDMDVFAPARVTEERCKKLLHEWGVNPKARIFLMPARLSPTKSHDVFIRAMAMLPDEYQDVIGVIIGDDQGRTDYRRELKKLIMKLKLEKRIILKDHCRDMPAAYSLAHTAVALRSTMPEAFGRIPVEAMAMGKKVIASKIGGFVETIEVGRTGWLVPLQNPQALSKIMVQALDEKISPADLAYSRKYVQKFYDKDKMLADTLTVYEEVLS